MPEVRKDVADCNIEIHQNAAERDITKLSLYNVDENMGQVINDFWDEEKHFRKKTGMYYEHYQWNSPNVDKGNLAVFHDHYLIPHTVVFGKTTVRETLKITGMGSAKRNWGYVKHINYGKRFHISTDNTEKKSMIYTKARLNKAKVHRGELEKMNDACADWGD